MATIHPLPPHGDANANFTKSCTIRTLSSRTWNKHQPDIGGCIVLTKLRCLVTLVSCALLVTDIPRTGLGVRNLKEFYSVSVLPSTAVRFGPFDYPVAHIWRVNSEGGSETLLGLHGTESVSYVPVWLYKYDTTSIGLRGAVELLNASDYPSLLLYKNHSDQENMRWNGHLSLNTTYTMLDGFIGAVHEKLRSGENTFTSMRYATRHNWVDSLQHFVLRFVTKNPAWRIHSVHATTLPIGATSIGICSSERVSKTSSPRPYFCFHPGVWKCNNPLNSSLPTIRLWEHIDLRLQSLQQRYPGLTMNVVVLTSQRLSSTSGEARSTFNFYEDFEIVVLTRGVQCSNSKTEWLPDLSHVQCKTIFMDDFRYERDTIQTNIVDWYNIIVVLRGGAQVYVWVRLVLLGYGAYVAAANAENKYSPCLVSTALIVLKIPFQVVVYSSLVPIICYVAALLLDVGFMDIFLDTNWSAIGGAVHFETVSFFQASAVQMRCVWLVALFGPIALFALRRQRENGLLGIRGLTLSFTASLTVFGPYKNLMFRDVNNISVFYTTQGSEMYTIINSIDPKEYLNSSTYTLSDSLKTLLVCMGIVWLIALSFNTIRAFLHRQGVLYETDGIILCSTPIVPCGTRYLWPATMLSIRFNVLTQAPPTRSGPRASNILAAAALKRSTSSLQRLQATNNYISNTFPTNLAPVNAQRTPTCHTQPVRPTTQSKNFCGVRNDLRLPSNCFQQRTNVTASIIQLMNIAMMTDPCNFLWLRVVGVQLYLYKLTVNSGTSSSDPVSYYAILPFPEDEMGELMGLSSDEYQLLDSASSRDVSLQVLLQCG